MTTSRAVSPTFYAQATDTSSPILTSSSGSYQTGPMAADANIVLTFNETVRAGSGSIMIFDSRNRLVISEDISGPNVTISGNKVVINPVEVLESGVTYTIRIDEGVLFDLAGNDYSAWHVALNTLPGTGPLKLDGSDNNDTLNGSAGGDTISGGAGNDSINGAGGHDLIYGGDEGTYPWEGDRIDAGDGNDTVYGNAGRDDITGGRDNDLLDGGAGDDTLRDSQGGDTLNGGAGNDHIISDEGGTAQVNGGEGNDTIRGDLGDTISGGDGNDRIFIRSTTPQETPMKADGGAGDDSFEVTWYLDTARVELTGGAGSDTYKASSPIGAEWAYTVTDFAAGAGGDRIDILGLLPWNATGNPFAGATPILKLVQQGEDTLLQVTQQHMQGQYWTTMRLAGVKAGDLTGANFSDGIRPDGSLEGATFTGTAAADTISGGIMDDTIDGGAGDDMLEGGAGNDRIVGGDANADGADRIYANAGNDTVIGGAGNDTIHGGEGDDSLDGGAGNDMLRAESGSATVQGGAGNDDILLHGSGVADGGNGDDQIGVSPWYADGDVTLNGGDGNDWISLHLGTAGKVSATMSGGAGSDRFGVSLALQTTAVTITDFSVADGDRLDLLEALPLALVGNPFGTQGYLRAAQSGADTVISIDRDGAAGTQHGWQQLVTLKGVTLANLNAASFYGGISPSGSETGLTLNGDAAANLLEGGILNDVLNGGGGNDTIAGAAGNDHLVGGDEVIAGHGDSIDGGFGNDTLEGGLGMDTLLGGEGADLLDGGAGMDSLNGGAGNDTLNGGDGNDRLQDDSGTNVLNGGAGNDELSAAGMEGSLLDGGTGNDTLMGGLSNDTLRGGSGNDVIRVQNYQNQAIAIEVQGGDGDDALELFKFGGPAVITASGGAGVDTYRLMGDFTGLLRVTDFAAGAGGDKFDVMGLQNHWASHGINPFGRAGHLRVVQEGADALLQYDLDGVAGTAYGMYTIAVLQGVDASRLTADNFTEGMRPNGDPTGLTLTGTDAPDTLVGGVADDRIDGGDSFDRIDGGGGNDSISGGAGADNLSGGSGDDTISGGVDNDRLNGETGNDSLVGGDGDDQLQDEVGNNTLVGGAGNDQLYSGGMGFSHLDGGDGNDLLVGGANGTMLGGAGNDTFSTSTFYYDQSNVAATMLHANGGDGDDAFEFSVTRPEQSIIATGGTGMDTYRLISAWSSPSQGWYMVTDFRAGAGGDSIDLSHFVSSSGATGNPFAAPAVVRVIQRGADAVVQFDPDGTHGMKIFQDALVLQNVSAIALTADNFKGYSPDGSNRGFTLAGTANADTIEGGMTNDTITGGGAADQVYGKAGDDLIEGQAGDDRLNGDDGDDIITGGDGDDAIDGGIGNDRLDGGAGDDYLRDDGGQNTISGGAGNDVVHVFSMEQTVVHGGDGDDQLHAGYVGNQLNGDAGNDRLFGNSGNDTLDGGSGSDYAMSGWSTNFTVTRDGDVITLTDNSGWMGTDTLTNIERISFQDTTIAYDVGADGIAGEVYRLYQAAFDRTPDAAGVGYWIAAADRGMSLDDIAGMFIQSTEFVSLYGAAPSHSELVTLMYTNTLHRAPDEAGLAFWTNALASGNLSTTDLLVAFSESNENQAAVAEVIGNGFPFQPYF